MHGRAIKAAIGRSIRRGTEIDRGSEGRGEGQRAAAAAAAAARPRRAGPGVAGDPSMTAYLQRTRGRNTTRV